MQLKRSWRTAEVHPQVLAEKGQVLSDELLLQGDRMGADDDAIGGRGGSLDGGDQVGEALADAGAGLDEQVDRLVERPLDGGGHLDLLGTLLVPGQSGGDNAAGAEDVGDGHGEHSPPGIRRKAPG